VFGDGVAAEGCILIGHAEMAHLHGDDVPDVGDGCELRNVVLERDVVVGAGCRLINEGAVKDLDAVDKKTGLGYVIQDGIIVVTKGTVLEPGTVI
jgi:glucose-1-phosphate adenylyltransferase